MFSKILIANRGEIACRIIKTARRMGIKCVAVCSKADRDALHSDLADEVVEIGPPPSTESYLMIDRIVAAAKDTGAEAVHPGYGFLAENPAFLRALDEAGIGFIGPGLTAIEVMGDKIASKAFAAKAGLTTIPGHAEVIEDAEKAVAIAEEIGFPVMLKASAGGGGKGMRIAWEAQEVAEGLASAMSEARSSFDDDRVFIEKYIETPRHIEIQVLADSHGNVIHLFERECSIQRRNQKVVEEAPSPFLDAEMRARMGVQAVALAKAVHYESAGTVEFIVDRERNFYFLEMNTRLQVEHPVTELVTGIDLVEQMIRVAAGEPLALAQNDVRTGGWAVESRIYAEDPFRGFLPSSGRLVRYRPPSEGERNGRTIRNDTGVFEGGEISIFYDPMIAKLITHGPDREAAIDHMADALDAFYIDGIQHNIPFLAALMQHPRWRAGDLSTGFIAEEYGEGFSPRQPDAEERDVLAAVATAIDHLGNMRRRRITQQMAGEGVRFSPDRVLEIGGMRQSVRVAGAMDGPVQVDLMGEDGEARRRLDIVSHWWPGEPVWFGRVGGREVAIQVRPILNGFDLAWRGVHAPVRVYTEREAELAALMPVKDPADTSRLLLCPMPGLVVSIAVEVGQEVKVGEPLCTVEAMKMENILRAERDNTIKAIHTAAGDSLAVDAVIMEFE